jgi:hypothetical protein
MSLNSSRRFLKQSGFTAGGFLFGFPAIVRGRNLNSRIHIEAIGVAGMGASDIRQTVAAGGHIAALCDLDSGIFGKQSANFPEARELTRIAREKKPACRCGGENGMGWNEHEIAQLPAGRPLRQTRRADRLVSRTAGGVGRGGTVHSRRKMSAIQSRSGSTGEFHGQGHGVMVMPS